MQNTLLPVAVTLTLVAGALTLTIPVSQLAGQEAVSPVDRTTGLQLISSDFELADGPCWDGGSLLIPDVKGETLFRFVPAQEKLELRMKEAGRISATFFNHDRAYLADNANGQISFLDGNQKQTVASFYNKPGEKPFRPNDLVVDRQGGIYVTFTPQGKVLYVSPDGTPTVAVSEIESPNGIALSPDESTLYVSEFLPKQIKSFEITSPGKTATGRVLAKMDDGPERGADGMTVDRAGNIYCAGPTAIWIWDPAGRLLDKIECPEKPINCSFGGRQMQTLYITGLGGLYCQAMKVCGVSPQPAGTVALKPAATQPRKQNEAIPSTRIPPGMEFDLDVVYATYGSRKLLADVFRPQSPGPHPCLVIVHGGGWHHGDKTKFRALAIRLAQLGYVTAAIEYRLAGEAAFPAAIHDCHAAVRFLRAHASEYGIDPQRIGAVGGSAGGHLVGLMASGAANPELQGEGGNPEQSARIQAAIVMAGPMEMLTGSVAERSRANAPNSNSNSWLRGTVDEKPELYRLADAHAQIDPATCPILFMVGEHDKPERNQPSRDKLKSLGIKTGVKIYADGKHGCWNRLPWFEDMAIDMDRYFQETLIAGSSK